MKKALTTIHNTETNEVVTREMTDEEFAQHQARQEAQKQNEANLELEAAAKAAAQAKLAALGLTVEDLTALGL